MPTFSINCPKPWKMRPEVLLCPNIPKPMHGVAPRIVLGQEWWDGERTKAFRATAYHCIACGIFKRGGRLPSRLFGNNRPPHRLEGHEIYDIDYLMGRMYYKEAVPLCTPCHQFIHCGRLEMMRQKGEVTDEEYQRIITHGTSILNKAKLKKPEPYAGPTADWVDWRLVINGLGPGGIVTKEYPPKFKNYQEWCFNFGVK